MKGYRIGKPIGYGASSTILEAWKRLPDGTEQAVAVKRLLPEHHGNPDIINRFMREATLCMDITQGHPNLITAYDFQRSGDGHLYMVMERVDGVSLDRLPSLPWPAIRYVLREVAHGLEYVHGHGVLHRDISPRNILATRDGGIKILDFGLARWLNTPRSDLGFKGTAPYSSPEAMQCLELDASADLYSLAAVGYQLITQRPPYGAGNALQISRRMVITRIEPLPTNVPEDLATLIMGLLQPWEKRTIRTASHLLRAIGEPVARSQDIARIVQDACGTAAESSADVRERGEPSRIAQRVPKHPNNHGSQIGRSTLLMVGLVSAALTVYLALAPGHEGRANGGTTPAKNATRPGQEDHGSMANRDSPIGVQEPIVSEESEGATPSTSMAEQDIGRTIVYNDPQGDENNHRSERKPRTRLRPTPRPKKHNNHFVPVPEGGQSIHIVEPIEEKGRP